MKDRFIVLIDFSIFSEQLLRFAYEWSRKINAELLLVHSTEILLPVLAPHESKTTLTAEANLNAFEKLKKYIETIIPEETSAKPLATEKPLVPFLHQILQEHYNDLVFLGIKGTGFLKKTFIGTQAVKVIDGIDNLIVAVPQNADCCSPEAIHVAVLKSYPLNIFEFNKFLKFTGESLKKIIFFSFISREDDRNSVKKYLKELVELYSDKYDSSYELYQGDESLPSLKNIIMAKHNEFIIVQRVHKCLLTKYS
jgi:hypothetical protein